MCFLVDEDCDGEDYDSSKRKKAAFGKCEDRDGFVSDPTGSYTHRMHRMSITTCKT